MSESWNLVSGNGLSALGIEEMYCLKTEAEIHLLSFCEPLSAIAFGDEFDSQDIDMQMGFAAQRFNHFNKTVDTPLAWLCRPGAGKKRPDAFGPDTKDHLSAIFQLAHSLRRRNRNPQSLR